MTNKIKALETELQHEKYLAVLKDQHQSAIHYLGENSDGAKALEYAIKYLKSKAWPRPAWDHFKVCGPLCNHIEFCEECTEIHNICPKHKDCPEESITWKKA